MIYHEKRLPLMKNDYIYHHFVNNDYNYIMAENLNQQREKQL